MTENDPHSDKRTENHKQIRRSLTTLHGWSLTFLYFSLVAWSAMIVFALVNFNMLDLTGGNFLPWLVLLGCVCTFASGMNAGRQFWQAMRTKRQTPPVALLPFLSIAITIAIAGTAFGALQ